jgi:hypothetical protein
MALQTYNARAPRTYPVYDPKDPFAYPGATTSGARYGSMKNLIEGPGDLAQGGAFDRHRRNNQPSTAGEYGDYGDGTYGGAGNGPKAQARRVGFQSLLDILLSQGATDPRLLNRQIQGLQRGTEADVNSLQESNAASGYDSGVGSAIVEARRAAGTEQIGQARADEARLQEERKRSDLQLLLDLVINPRAQRRGQNLALEAAKYAARHGGGGSGLSEAGAGLGSIANILKLFRGGGGAGDTSRSNSNNGYSGGGLGGNYGSGY